MIYNTKALERFENVTVPTGTGGTQFNFPDQPNLRGVPVHAISVYWSMFLTPDGAQLPDISIIKQSFLVLYVKNDEYIRIPLSHLITNYASGNSTSSIPVNSNGYIPMGGLHVIWSKSYVKVPAGYTPTDTRSFMFGVFYSKH